MSCMRCPGSLFSGLSAYGCFLSSAANTLISCATVVSGLTFLERHSCSKLLFNLVDIWCQGHLLAYLLLYDEATHLSEVVLNESLSSYPSPTRVHLLKHCIMGVVVGFRSRGYEFDGVRLVVIDLKVIVIYAHLSYT